MSRPSSCLRLPVVAVVAAIALAACGDDDPASGADAGNEADASVEPVCVDPSDVELEDAPYASPTTMPAPATGCAPGGLADLDLDGRWHLRFGDDPFAYSFPRVTESCEGGVTVDPGRVPTEAWTTYRDDDVLFWTFAYADDSFSLRWSYQVCAGADDSDGLAAVGVSCFDGQCEPFEGRMTSFARPEGESDAEGMRLVGEIGGAWEPGFTANVRVADGVAYVARLGELRVVDVSDPSAPTDLARLGVTGNGSPDADYNDLKTFEVGGARYLILAGNDTTLVDVSDPAAPTVVGTLGEYSHSIFIDESLGKPMVYLANYEAEVPVYDLSDPAAPVLVARPTLPPDAAVHDLFATPTRLYVNATTAGFLVVDVDLETGSSTLLGTMPASYSHASWITTIGDRTVAIHGDEGRGAHLRVVDVDPESPEFMSEIGRYQTREDVSIHNMMIVGDEAYVAYYRDGMRILDLSDPTAPTLEAYFHTWDVEGGSPSAFQGAVGFDLDTDAGLVYVAESSRGLVILEEDR